MWGVPDDLVPLILITSQPKEERTWVSISRRILTEKNTKQLTFCLFCLDSLEAQMEKQVLNQSDAHWLH